MEGIEEDEAADDREEGNHVAHAFGQGQQQPEGEHQGHRAEDQIRSAAAPTGAGLVLQVAKEHIIDHIPGELAHQHGGTRKAGLDADHIGIVEEHVELDQARDNTAAKIAYTEFQFRANRKFPCFHHAHAP